MESPQQPVTRKMTVGILFGGKSAEHEVSLQSANNVLQALDKEKFTPILIGIDKTGKWHTKSDVHEIGQVASLTQLMDTPDEVTFLPGNTNRQLINQSGHLLDTIDVIFPVLHGPMGEDGSIQGFLELADMPYVGPGVLGSSIGMDKDVMKRLLRDAGIPVANFVTVTSVDVNAAEIVARLGLPVFVKPANMGSSIGVSKVSEANDLTAAIEDALKFDTKVLIEEAIVGDEIECAILGNDAPEASIIGRVIPQVNGFYSYKAKYIDESGAILEMPAAMPASVSEKARQVAIDTFKVLGCEGMSRVDMFATEDGTIIVNEINTIPGFTKISMYPKLWEMSGLSYTDLITRLLSLAIERHERRQKLQTSYEGHL